MNRRDTEGRHKVYGRVSSCSSCPVNEQLNNKMFFDSAAIKEDNMRIAGQLNFTESATITTSFHDLPTCSTRSALDGLTGDEGTKKLNFSRLHLLLWDKRLDSSPCGDDDRE